MTKLLERDRKDLKDLKDRKDLKDQILETSGGKDNWESVNTLIVRATLNGSIPIRHSNVELAKRFEDKPDEPKKLKNFIFHVKVKDIENSMEYLVLIEDYPIKGYTGYFAPDRCYILDKNGLSYKSRLNPRQAFFGGFYGLWRILRWDELDMLYFLGYTVYNYCLIPYIFTFKGVKTKEIGRVKYPPDIWPLKVGDPRSTDKKYDTDMLKVLRVRFPKRIPTHCKEQIFYVYDGGERNNLIHSMKYSLEIGWLLVPHLVHFEMAYKDSISSSSKDVKAIPLRVPYQRKAYWAVQTSWIWKRVFRPNPLSINLEIDDIKFKNC